MIKLLRDIKDSTTTLATRVTEQPSSLCGLQSRASDIQKYLVEIATLATRVTEQLSSLRGLQSRASDIQKYLLEVAAGTMPVNHQIYITYKMH